MSPKTPATRRSAAPCRRIEIVASRRVAAVWILWIVLLCCTIFAAELPLLVRIAICLGAAVANARILGVCVLLRGGAAVKSLEWFEQGDMTARVGPALVPMTATVGAGSFRLGTLLALRLQTSSGLRVVLIDGGLQQPRAFRRLCRRLDWSQSSGSGG